jgi:hypothetical protein
MQRLFVILCLALCGALATGCGQTDEERDKVCREGRNLQACDDYGRCTRNESTMGGTFCRALKLEDCQRSNIACKEQGRCGISLAQDADDCIVIAAVDCASSLGCKTDGLCAKKGNACIANKPEHCQRSSGCNREAKCHLSAEGCMVYFMKK